MGVYSRFKKDHDGLRKLVELLETTPKVRREKMVEVGNQEDPDYTQKALMYVMTFQDILDMPDSELSEVMAKVPPKMAAFAINRADKETQDRFLRCSPPKVASEIRDFIDVEVGLAEVGGGQLKLVAVARELERAGFVNTKKIPPGNGVD